MSTLKAQENLSLHDVILKLNETHSIGNTGLLMAAEMIVSYFGQPTHEITIVAMKERQRHFPLFLSWRRLPFELINKIVAEVECLLKFAEEVQVANQGEQLMAELSPRIPKAHLVKDAVGSRVDAGGKSRTSDQVKGAA